MRKRPATRWTSIGLLAMSGYLLGSGACVTRTDAADFAEATVSRFATLFIDSLVFNPLQDALNNSPGAN